MRVPSLGQKHGTRAHLTLPIIDADGSALYTNGMAQPGLQVTLVREGDVVTLALVGEAGFDFDASEKHIRNVMAHKPACVVVEAGKLTFITSIGMCFLINLRRRMRENGGTMRLRGLKPQVRKVMEQAHVIHLFDLPAEEMRPEG